MTLLTRSLLVFAAGLSDNCIARFLQREKIEGFDVDRDGSYQAILASHHLSAC